MKKVLSILLCLTVASWSYAAITFDVASSAGPTSATGNTTTTINAASGEFLVMVWEVTTIGTACATKLGTITVSDTASNSWTQIGSGYASSGNYDCAQMWYANVTTGNTSDVVKAAWSSNANLYAGIVVEEFTNVATTSQLDGSAQGTAIATPLTSANFSTVNANDLLICGAGNYYSNLFTASTIGTNTAQIPTNGTVPVNHSTGGDAAEEYYILSSSTPVNIKGKMNITSGNVAGGIICGAFQAAGAAAPSGNPFWFGAF